MAKKKTKSLGRAKGDLPRTPRMRFVEPPSKRDGNPFFALRVPESMLSAMERKAKAKGVPRTAWARGVLARAAGFKLEADNDEA